MIDVTAAIVGSVARMITNSMQVYPSYTLYFLNVLMIVTSIAMIYFVVEAVSDSFFRSREISPHTSF